MVTLIRLLLCLVWMPFCVLGQEGVFWVFGGAGSSVEGWIVGRAAAFVALFLGALFFGGAVAPLGAQSGVVAAAADRVMHVADGRHEGILGMVGRAVAFVAGVLTFLVAHLALLVAVALYALLAAGWSWHVGHSFAGAIFAGMFTVFGTLMAFGLEVDALLKAV